VNEWLDSEPGGLRETLESACDEAGCAAGALTVLAAQNDPFRVDTPARHRDGKWLAVRLLADIRSAFHSTGAENLASAALIQALCADEEAPLG